MHNEESFFSKNIHKNINMIKEHLYNSPELSIRYIQFDTNRKHSGALLYINGIVNTELIRESIIEPLLNIRKIDEDTFMSTLALHHIRSESVEEVTSISSTIDEIVRGKTLVIIDGFECGIIVDTAEWQQRSIEQSSRQRNILGPMIAFTEQLKSNLNLLHNMILSPTLMIEKKQIGRIKKTDVAIVYLNNRVDQSALKEVRLRIDTLQVDYVLESRVIEEAIEGKQKTIFPLAFQTELPDAVTSALYEGRIAVFVNGTPSATIIPNLFVQYMQHPSDYYTRLRSMSRLLTFFCFFVAFLLPGLYVSITNFHENWFSKKVIKHFFTHSDTFLPFWLEIYVLLLLLQIISMSSYRMSKEMLILVSLISTITIGTTAVEAKLIHPLSLIIIGIAYLSNTMISNIAMSFTINSLRYIFLFLGGVFGIVGIGIGLFILIIHMVRLRSVGVPYLAPIIPFHFKEFKDVFFRGDLRKLINSPNTYPHDEKDKSSQ
ncbi:spore germination protein [Gottfriedia luciferensis]|uniref:spore germination protein n=1 Tax=Gottfriedia luciferensis TaxID=178774 RepID=UPI000B433444|nr:spore germination protein [Gottfriedia luciferensis]